MAVEAFISYSHADDGRRARLHKHLAMLRREGLLQSWSDHEILAGAELNNEILEALERAGIFIALLSPDYLDSNFCYDVEFKRALELKQLGRLRIVGVVVEPCDWQHSPFGSLLVMPKDGKAIAEWTNENTAYLNVVEMLRRILSVPAGIVVDAEPRASHAPVRRVKVKQDFDFIQRSEFADKAFGIVRAYFEAACAELQDASEHIRSKYETMSSLAFTCTIVNRARTRGSDAHITVHRNKTERMSTGDISFIFASYAAAGSSNGWLSVDAGEFELHLKGTIGRFGISDEKKWAPHGAAEALWNLFIEQAGLEYEM